MRGVPGSIIGAAILWSGAACAFTGTSNATLRGGPGCSPSPGLLLHLHQKCLKYSAFNAEFRSGAIAIRSMSAMLTFHGFKRFRSGRVLDI
jgi:hypothetical protein